MCHAQEYAGLSISSNDGGENGHSKDARAPIETDAIETVQNPTEENGGTSHEEQ